MNFNLEYYRAFYYVAKYQSTSKAAEALYISQPAVSRSVSKLEENLGCRLFQRTPRGMQMTTEGEVLYRHVVEAFKSFELGQQKVGRLAHYETGEIKIGTTETPLYQYLLPRLSAFHKRFPKVRMDITGSITSELWSYLKNGTIDVAFAVSPLPADMDCRLYPIEDIQDVFIAGPAFAHLQGRVVTLQELMQYPIAYVDKRSSARRYLAGWLQESGIPFEPQYTVRTSTLVLPLVRSGLSIGVLPRSVLQNNNPDGQVFEIRTDRPIPPRQIYLAINEAFPTSAISREFVRTIVDELHTE